RVRPAIHILRVEFSAASMREKIIQQELKIAFAKLAVSVPPNCFFREAIDNSVLVLGTTSGVHAGFGADRATLHDRRLARRNRMFVELRRQQVPMNGGEILETEFVGTERAVS